MPEVEINCVQCKEIFIFSEKEQEIFYQRNMMTPQRCPQCRSKKMVNKKDTIKLFEIVCDHCGKRDKVPFQPKVGRAVLCKDCYNANRSKTRMV